MTLPKGSRMVELGDVCEHTLGKMLDQKKNKGVLRPYLRNPNVQWFDFDLRELREMPFEDREIHKFQLEAGDVVICEGGEAGRAAVWDARMSGIQIQKALHRVRCGPELFNQYLVHRLFFDAKRGRLSEYFTGTTIPHFTGQDFHRYRIPLPPLAEQKRIAAVLDKADDLRGKRRQALATLDTLLQSVFLDMFGDPVTNPKKWPVKQAGDIGTVQGGLTLNQRRKLLPVTAAYLRVANVQRGFINTAVVKNIGLTAEERERTALQSGDLLIVEGNGNPNEIGRAAVWDGSIADCVHQNHLIRIRPNSASLTSDYAVAFVNSDGGKRYFNRAGNTTSGLVTINISVVRNIPFPVPPIDLQRRYSRSIASLNEQRQRSVDSLAQMDTLFAALQSAAFAGTLFNGEMVKAAASKPAHPTPRPAAV